MAAGLTYLESLRRALHAILADNERAIVLGEDILDPYGGAFKLTLGLSSRFPDRVLTTPISEAAIVGVGVGLGDVTVWVGVGLGDWLGEPGLVEPLGEVEGELDGLIEALVIADNAEKLRAESEA